MRTTISHQDLQEALTPYLEPSGGLSQLFWDSDKPNVSLNLAFKINGVQDDQIVGDRIVLALYVSGKLVLETKNLTVAVEAYNKV